MPVALKDNLCVKGVRTTASSKISIRSIRRTAQTVVDKLESAGAIIVGKTNCDEFAMGSSNENSAYGPMRNPWATDRTGRIERRLGGSGRGAVRPIGTGLGYRRIDPAAGVVLRRGRGQTHLRASLAIWTAAFASSLDQIGPFTRSVSDAALALSALSGRDAMDSTSSLESVPDFAAALTGDIRGVRVGVPQAFVTDGVDDMVRRAFNSALDVLRDRGATLVDVELPHALCDPGLLPDLHSRGEAPTWRATTA